MLEPSGIPEPFRAFALALLDRPEPQAELFQLLATLGPRAGASASVDFANLLAATWPDHPIVRAGVAAFRWAHIPDYHLRMILDARRNAAYAAAIAALVEPGMDVLEIGTGSGVLAMLAARAGAGRVFAVEENPVMLRIARENLARNGLAGRVELIEGNSGDPQVRRRLPERSDALIHELFSATLLDEGVLAYLTEARDTLLRPGGLLLPERAALHGHVEGNDFGDRLDGLRDVHGLDLSALRQLRRTRRYLAKDQRGRLDPLSGPRLLAEVDLATARTRQRTHDRVEVGITRDGAAHGIVQWIGFGFPGGIEYSNPPEVDSHWALIFHGLDDPRAVAAGEQRTIVLDRLGWCTGYSFE